MEHQPSRVGNFYVKKKLDNKNRHRKSEDHHASTQLRAFKVSAQNKAFLEDLSLKSADQQELHLKALADPLSLFRPEDDSSFFSSAYTGMSNEYVVGKRRVNVVVIGPFDSGKSTITGHLLCERKAIEESYVKRVAKAAADLHKKHLKYAFLLDKLVAERKLGMTMKISFGNFQTVNYDITILDTPGHEDYIMNMISGTSQSDSAVFIIDSTTGGFEAGLSQTRDYALIAFFFGVQEIICCVNKMDALKYSKRKYDKIVSEVSSILVDIGFTPENITFLPTSGMKGDNLTKPSTNLNWFKGPTLLDAFDSISHPKRALNKSLRLPLCDVLSVGGVGTVPVGCVQAGVLKPGMMVNFGPTGLSARVNSVERQRHPVSEALPGDFVGFHVQNIAAEFLKSGYVASDLDHDKAKGAVSFIARIVIMNHPSQIRNGYAPILYCHTAQIPVKFELILCKYDRKSGDRFDDPECLEVGDEGLVKIIPAEPVVVEPCADYPSLGRIVVRDMKQTVAVGIVLSVEREQT